MFFNSGIKLIEIYTTVEMFLQSSNKVLQHKRCYVPELVPLKCTVMKQFCGTQKLRTKFSYEYLVDLKSVPVFCSCYAKFRFV